MSPTINNMTIEEYFATLDADAFAEFIYESYIQPYYKDKFFGAITERLVLKELKERLGAVA